MKIKLTQSELEVLFLEQLKFLECSAISYDKGFEGEIKRLAVTVRVLVHDTNNSTSLLSLISRKETDYVDQSNAFEEANLQSHSSLVQMSISNSGMKILPILDGGPFNRKVSFNAWWNGIVFVDSQRNEFSRKDIVLSLANKEGGAHVDNRIDKQYLDLRKNNSLGWYSVSSDGVETPGSDQVPATMRHIAHEILKTFKEGYTCNPDTTGADVLIIGGGVFEGTGPSPTAQYNLPKNRPIVNGQKIGRNDPCVCASGKKYKFCCIR